MDLSFQRFDMMRAAAAMPAPIDYQNLVVSLAAYQASSPTARTQAQLESETPSVATPVGALVQLLGARPGWVSAVARLGGSFHPGVAGDHGKPA
jgi:hypothetical protein